MTNLPDTTRKGPRRRIPPLGYAALPAVCALVAAMVLFLVDDGTEPRPGERVYAAGVEEISAVEGDAPYPGPDASRFGRGTRAVRVYLRLENAPAAGGMVATVERSGRASLLSRLFGGGRVRAEGADEGRLTVSEGAVSGVVSFVVRASDGGALPPGGYGVEVRFAAGEEGGAGRLAARKYFRIGDPQT